MDATTSVTVQSSTTSVEQQQSNNEDWPAFMKELNRSWKKSRNPTPPEGASRRLGRALALARTSVDDRRLQQKSTGGLDL
ncbi:unnamed protein product [Adineta steineri]|uniref:Uncharacterized protein n=1 Tax=Adineta steineri TaxID=433720 RepID=A0A818V8F9_9BILA|nr:unnamed protein product [Adineta steineri]